ncbi:MAG: stress response translation initiation inhibitor YciH [Calditrichaceae bacterium]|nr:stress response translation initiation inhibitor YciH [Calditrichaceae bacterium]MBN2707880.1 stress response translation initiation inhibitor YciH [Calditrichaceae bacterium]RQV97828.1 MAG: stress response translation initiation inhibitor YciH [Calditrichota bacterium]
MDKRNIVYSTDPDWRPEEDIEEQSVPLSGQTAYIQRESKHRGGKTVTLVSNLSGDLKSLQKELQKHCATGGTLKNKVIEIQGDHRDKIADYLQSRNIKVKFRGG